MAKGYVILTEAIKDEAGMEAYGRASAASISFWPMSASSDKDLERKW